MANETTETVETKTRKSPDLKDKVVVFTLTKEMRLADLAQSKKNPNGYQRKEVELLFTKLAEEGVGVYEKGHLGRGCSAKFVCGDTFPETYTITTQVRRLRNDYTGKPAAAKPESVIMAAEESVLLAGNDTEAPEAPVEEVTVNVIDQTTTEEVVTQ